MSPDSVSSQNREHEALAAVLEHLVSSGPVHETDDKLHQGTSDHTAITPGPISVHKHTHWWGRFFPGSLESTLDRLFASYHMGNYVAIRGQPGQKIFESMPIYVRIGMHLLFYKSKEQSFLRYKSVEDLLKAVSIRQGKVYDDESNPQAVLEHIQSFISTYSIDLDELLRPDPSLYPSFNSFFFRKLKPGARPIAEPDNAAVVSSCADCRLTVFNDVAESTQYWIKGQGFTLNRLVGDTNLADRCFPPGSSLAILRLAPADYHRYHHPVGPVVCGPTKHVPGEYFTVNVSISDQHQCAHPCGAGSDTKLHSNLHPVFAAIFLLPHLRLSILWTTDFAHNSSTPGATNSRKPSTPALTYSLRTDETWLCSIGPLRVMEALRFQSPLLPLGLCSLGRSAGPMLIRVPLQSEARS